MSQSLVLEAALASHLSPDGADRLEAALARRLDRMTRQIERIERHVDISTEALAVFVRFWLTSTPHCPTRLCRPPKPRAVSATKVTSKRLAGVSPVGASSLTRSSEMLAEMRGAKFRRRRVLTWESAIPAACNSILRPYARFNVVASPQLWPFLINPADSRLRTEAT